MEYLISYRNGHYGKMYCDKLPIDIETQNLALFTMQGSAF